MLFGVPAFLGLGGGPRGGAAVDAGRDALVWGACAWRRMRGWVACVGGSHAWVGRMRGWVACVRGAHDHHLDGPRWWSTGEQAHVPPPLSHPSPPPPLPPHSPPSSQLLPPDAEVTLPDAVDLLRRMAVADPTQRLRLRDVLVHPWFLKDLPAGARSLNAAYLGP
eukprot:363298-Chlamydomonas_euryale.AAC.1